MEEKMNMEEYNDGNILETEIDDAAVEENDSIYFSISSFGADYTVDGLIKRLEKNQIVVPKFQRRYVWDVKKASRFIESLIIGLPVPGIFLSKDAIEVGKDNAGNTNTPHLIIDGQQSWIFAVSSRMRPLMTTVLRSGTVMVVLTSRLEMVGV